MGWKPIGVPFDEVEDADILAWLKEQKSAGGALRDIVRAHFRQGQQAPETVPQSIQAAPLDERALGRAIADGIVEGLQRAGIKGLGQSTPLDDEAIDVTDELTQKMANISFSDVEW